jgi:hypothetical protein
VAALALAGGIEKDAALNTLSTKEDEFDQAFVQSLMSKGITKQQKERIASNKKPTVDVQGSALSEWTDHECYVVVLAGLVAEREENDKSDDHTANHVNAATQTGEFEPCPNIEAVTWRYVGHTEPAYLEGRATGISDEGSAVLSVSVGFGMSVPVPLRILQDAVEAAKALDEMVQEHQQLSRHVTAARKLDINGNDDDDDDDDNNDDYKRKSKNVSMVNYGLRVKARIRFQLRWYTGEDEDRMMQVGRRNMPINESVVSNAKPRRSHLVPSASSVLATAMHAERGSDGLTTMSTSTSDSRVFAALAAANNLLAGEQVI